MNKIERSRLDKNVARANSYILMETFVKLDRKVNG